MKKITPFLWFDTQAEEAMNFYTSIFKKSKKGAITRYGEAGPGKKGSVMTASFTLDGQDFIALNGGPNYQFTHAISFSIDCKTQKEVDYYWEKLSAGGKIIQCGWLVDKFGLSWQVVPSILPKYLADRDAVKSQRVMQAMFKMQKLDIATLKQAYKG